LKNFAAIDLDKINRDRQDHMKQALEDNMKEKEQELDTI
jgi:predicted transcriptional regulator